MFAVKARKYKNLPEGSQTTPYPELTVNNGVEILVNVPSLWFIENIPIPPTAATYTNLPVGSTVIPYPPNPDILFVAGLNAVKAPVVWLIEKPETTAGLLPPAKLIVYTYLPVGSTVISYGLALVAIAVVIEVNAPVVWLIEYCDTVLPPKFTTYANLPVGSTAIEYGVAPAATGVPIDVNIPF